MDYENSKEYITLYDEITGEYYTIKNPNYSESN